MSCRDQFVDIIVLLLLKETNAERIYNKCLCVIPHFSSKTLIYPNKDMSAVKMPNTSYINQQMAQCALLLCGSTAIQTKSFTKYRITAPSSRTVILSYQTFLDCCNHSHSGVWKGHQSARKSKSSSKKSFKTTQEVHCKKLGSGGVHHTVVSNLYKKYRRCSITASGLNSTCQNRQEKPFSLC